jgi:hypothetical protein
METAAEYRYGDELVGEVTGATGIASVPKVMLRHLSWRGMGEERALLEPLFKPLLN